MRLRSFILKEEHKMKTLVLSMMLVAIAMFGIARAAELAVGNPSYDNSWSSLDAITATESGHQYTLDCLHTIDGSSLDVDTGTMCDSQQIWDVYWDAPWNAGQTNPHPGTVSCMNWICYEFDKAYPLTTMHIWNYNYNAVSFCGAGAKSVVVQYSLTGGPNASEWSNLGTFQVDKGTALPTFVGNDVCNFRAHMAKYVCISIISDWGSPYGDQGINETRFYYTDDPCNYVPPAGWQLTMAASPSSITTITPVAGSYVLDAGTLQAISAATFVNCPHTWVFDHWTGDGITDPTQANTTVLMTADRTVTAVFVENNQCGDTCHQIKITDINKDCTIDFKDFAQMAADWLQCTKVVCP
jgi:hypothetical protein